MAWSPANAAIRRPVGTLALASVVFVLGLFFIDRLPVHLLPPIEYSQIRVTVNYPGVAPEGMEQQVTRVLEQNLAATEGLVTIDSRVSQGRTNVNLLFESGTNLDLALQDATRYLELARTQLPSDIEPPRLYKFDASQDPIWQAGFSSTVRSEAEVRDGHRQHRLFARLDSRPAAQVSVFKLPGANTVAVVDQVNASMTRLERSGYLPEDIHYQAISDPAFFVCGAVRSVASAALLGGLLAMLMVFLFLGSLRKSFVIGLSIPIALMATFAMMGASELTLNIISLGGLALGVGLLLDNAIVMLENIYRHREQLGKAPDQAAYDGASEVVSAITAGTLTNLAAVVPFLMISGIAALIFRDLILTISFAILATLAAALTLVPMLAALLARVRFESGIARSAPLRLFNRGVEVLGDGYRWLLLRVLCLRWVVVGLAVALFAGALMLGGSLGNEFLPQVDDGHVSVRMVLPPGTPPDETDRAARRIEAVLDELPQVDTVFALVGGHLGGGIVNERPGTANIRVQLAPVGTRPELSAGQWVALAQRELDSLDLPGARITVRPPAIRGLRFGVTGADLSITVVGDDFETMRAYAREITARLEGIPGLEGVEVGRGDQTPLLRVGVDRERAADLGLRVSEIGEAIRAAVDGAVRSRPAS